MHRGGACVRGRGRRECINRCLQHFREISVVEQNQARALASRAQGLVPHVCIIVCPINPPHVNTSERTVIKATAVAPQLLIWQPGSSSFTTHELSALLPVSLDTLRQTGGIEILRALR